MKIGNNKFVSISYTLTVEGKVAEAVPAERPLEFVYGKGYLLPKFEEALTGLQPGDPFAFVLPPADAYGEKSADMVVDLPKEIFMVNGTFDRELVVVGNQLPMSDNRGNRMLGTVCAVEKDTVTMDFNHPMAGSTLDFSGSVVAVREATEADLMMTTAGCGGSCDNCDDDCYDKECACSAE